MENFLKFQLVLFSDLSEICDFVEIFEKTSFLKYQVGLNCARHNIMDLSFIQNLWAYFDHSDFTITTQTFSFNVSVLNHDKGTFLTIQFLQ